MENIWVLIGRPSEFTIAYVATYVVGFGGEKVGYNGSLSFYV